MRELVIWGFPKSAPNVDPIYYRGTSKKGNIVRGFRLRGGRFPLSEFWDILDLRCAVF